MQFFRLVLWTLLVSANSVVTGQQDTYITYRTGPDVDTSTQALGGVCLMGGRSENVTAMRWFVERAAGGDILVLRASGSDGYNDFIHRELGIPVHSVESIVFKTGEASSDPYIHRRIQEAEAIWLAGGNQSKYVAWWRHTAIDSLINDAIKFRQIAIGGTSAGMAVLGTPYFSAANGTVTSDTALLNPYDRRVIADTARFLEVPFMLGIITDTHYDERGRQGRHVAFMARGLADTGHPVRGLACDEYTAVCIDPAGQARVYGTFPDRDDYAYFIQPNPTLVNSLPEVYQADYPLTWDHDHKALRVYRIPGTMDGQHGINMTDWNEGTGGKWGYWWVREGVLEMEWEK